MWIWCDKPCIFVTTPSRSTRRLSLVVMTRYIQMDHVLILKAHLLPVPPGQSSTAHGVPHRLRRSDYKVLATGHCPGAQTINRAELFAMLIGAEQASLSQEPAQVSFYTDSQFVVNVIAHIDADTIHESPHKRDHWDLIIRLCQVWDRSRFHVFKIKSHLQIDNAHSYTEAYHILGNTLADEGSTNMYCRSP